MPKICEICKQPYPDNLTSCPNCDVIDVFDTVPLPPGSSPADSQDVALGGEPKLPAVSPAPKAPAKPGSKGAGEQPSTKVQGPLPPVGASVGPSAAKSSASAAPSPLMAKALEASKAPAAPAQGTPAPAEPGKATMVAPQSGKPTMVAPQGAKPTMVAPQGAKPTMVAPQGAKPTMVAPQGGGKETMLAKTGSATVIAPEGTPPLEMPGEQGAAPASGAKKTMLPQGQGKPTMLAKAATPTTLAPEGTQPLEIPGEAKPVDKKKTMLPQGAGKPTVIAKTGQATKLAPEGTEPLDLPEGTSKPDAKKTMLPKGVAQPTMLAKAAQPTTLAPEGTEPLELPAGAKSKKTMLPPPPKPTTLAPEGEAPLEYPEGIEPPSVPMGGPSSKLMAKPTMLPKQPQPTKLAPAEEPPLDYPEGMAPPPPESEAKKTMLPKGAATPTTLAPPEESAPFDYPPGEKPPKKTMLPKGAATPTTLAPPEEATPLALPGTGDVAESVELSGGTGTPSASLSGELAREALETASTAPLELASAEVSAGSVAAEPSRPLVKPHYKRRWLGGMVLGVLLSAGTLTGLWAFRDEEPVKGWLREIGLQSTRIESDKPLEDAMIALDAGEFQRVLDILTPADTDGPKHFAIRGEARWLLYLQKKNGDRSKMSKNDVADILEELNRAKDAPYPWKSNAELVKAHIEEMLGEPTAADELYRKGAAEHKDYQPLFNAGRNRIASGGKDQKGPAKAPPKEDGAKKDGGQARVQPADLEFLEVLALLLTAQQGAAAPLPEAGTKFWEAYRAAQSHNYKEAIEALKEAQKLHDQYRFQRLRKAQNPRSDPNEEIFLRASSDLLAYWEIRARLQSQGYDLTQGTLQALDKLLLDRKPADEVLREIAKALETKPTQADILERIKGIEEDRKIAKAVREALKDGKYVKDEKDDAVKAADALIADAKTKLKIAVRVEKAGFKDPDTDKAVEKLVENRDDLQDTFDKVGQKLADAKYIEPKPDKPTLLAGVDLAIEAATSPLVAALGRTLNGAGRVAGVAPLAGGPTFDLAQQIVTLRGQNEILAERLRLVRTSREMLDFWLPVLENKEQKELKDILEHAGRDARRVQDDQGADAQAKAAALTVQGMVQRLEGKYDEARAALAESLKTPRAGNESPWRKYAANTLRELNDPTAYYLPRGEELVALGRYADALNVLNAGVAAFPKDGRCLALRSQARLEEARSKAKAQLTLGNLAEARKDAEAAIALGATGEGNYALGRIFEEVGDRGAAEKAYRTAVAAHPANDRAGARYRVALGRILLKLNPLPGQPAAAPAPAGESPVPKIGRLVQPQTPDTLTLLALVLTGLQAVPDDDLPELDEIIRLAEQAIKAGNYEGYLIKAGALARKGQWTEALKVYAEGLRYLIRPEYAEGLAALVNNHPAFNLPDPLRQPDPLRAEKHFGAGLRYYFAGQYTQAERELLEAYRNNGQDARILYYLGLARLPQPGKRSAAIEMFRMAATLEQQNKPSPAAVNASLERIQGQLRQTLNNYRP